MKKILLISVVCLFVNSPSVFPAELSDEVLSIAKERKLSPEDIYSAVKTFTPANKKDEFLCFNSGGQAGSVVVYGVPSMKIYKYIPTAAADPATGYLHDEHSKKMVREATFNNKLLTWADTHHPSFSETDGKYDGRYLFINDKANPRIFVIDLRDFETKQVIANPIYMSAHGGAFVTPNSEYIIEGAQYPAPSERKYYPLTQESFNKNFRGGITFHKFDNTKGRIDTKNSFTVIAPPYTQDLSDAGKGESYGYSFTNSFCSERYIGTGYNGKNPPFEAGCSAKDTDFLHIVNWKKAEQLFKQGKVKMINNHAVIPLEVAAKEGVLFLIPEPKSPHGSDISPDGRYIVVSGKLDTNATIYDFRKIKKLMEDKDFAEYDEYGVPVLDLKKSIHGQVQLGLGPLHSQFGKEPGVVYTSIFLDSQVAKWDYINKKVLDKVSINYNIGHLVSMQGDSVEPAGRYVVSLNKLAVDRFTLVGPLLPQNHQLIDTTGPKMRVIYDLPLPLGEPHYTVCTDINKLHPMLKYPMGTDARTMTVSSNSTVNGKERISKKGNKVEVFATISSNGIKPSKIEVTQGDEVFFHLTNIEDIEGKNISFTVNGIGALNVVSPGETSTVRFVATQAGQFLIETNDISSQYEENKFGMVVVKSNAQFESRRVTAMDTFRKYNNVLMKIPDPTEGKTLTKEEQHPGRIHFEEYGCVACHILGQEQTAPNLIGVTQRRDKAWIKKFVSNPEKFYNDPTIAPLVKKFGLQMPNLEVKPDHLDLIIEYLDQYKK